jgi:lambda family phage portal protein
MREVKSKAALRATSELVDGVVGVFSPKAAFERKKYRFGYDAIDKTRTRKKRTDLGGTADQHLDEKSLYDLREIAREMCRNNPLAKGLLRTERNGVIGTGVKIEARTDDAGWNKEAESLWSAEMLDSTCDITGRFNFNQMLRMLFLAYRRDGDAAVIFTDDGLQLIEGEQIGTPLEFKDAEFYDIVNGIAFSKQTKKIIGYFVGSPDKYGYIKTDSYRKYLSEYVHHLFNPERSSQSRGEPALASSINFIDKLCEYVDAELVAAKVNACFSMFISQKDSIVPDGYTGGISGTGKDEDGKRLEKISPGIIVYGEPGEEAMGIGQVRPGTLFDPFVMRMLMFIGRPLCLPMALISLDYSGATFMNIRLAYQEARDNWTCEQDDVVRPFVTAVRKWKLQQWLRDKKISARDDMHKIDIYCRRWPYVDPFREAQADGLQLENNTTNRTIICARQGGDFAAINEQRIKEDNIIGKSEPSKKLDDIEDGE